MQPYSNLVTDIMNTRFPALAQRVYDCEASLRAQKLDYAKPLFGCFYNYCINGPQGEVKGVSTEPHVDGKNLALMFCCIFIYGECHWSAVRRC